jgi:hypothetical protein
MNFRLRQFGISGLALVLIASLLLYRMFDTRRYDNPDTVIAWDVVSYYAYLPATFIEHDLSLSFTDHEHNGTYWPETLPDGHKVIKTSMGMSLMYCPFFLMAHLAAPVLGYPADGFSKPYAFALVLASLFYSLLGLCLLRRLLRRHFSDITTAVTLIILAIGTNLYWYTLYEGPMSHAYSFCLMALLALLTEIWHERPTYGRSLALGLTLGLLSLVRPVNALAALYFLFYNAGSKEQFRAKWQLLLLSWRKILLMAAAILAVWCPQMVYWYHNTGHLLFYSYGSDERFFFGSPKILEGLFSFRKGWLIYTPVMAFALLGLIPLYKRNRLLFWPVAIFTAIYLYVVFCWWCWWYGGSCGMRALIDAYALLALPLAAWLEWLQHRRLVLRFALLAVFTVAFYLSALTNLQYINGAIHWDSMTRAAYFDSFFHTHPSDRFASLLEEPDYEAARQGNR